MTENGTQSTELTQRQRRTIAALLSAKNVRDAANQVKVPERTLYSWLRDPVFKAALYEAEGQLIDQATRRLLKYQEAAINVVLSIMADSHYSASVRLRAAQTILDTLFKLRELRNVEERLAALEELVRP
jgi:hypothetical protein